MPDGSGNYQGDWAVVLPDNTAPLMHLHDQFLQIEENHQRQLAKQAAEDAKRRGSLQKYIGDTLDRKGLLSGTVQDENLSHMITDAQVKNYGLIGKVPDEELRTSIARDVDNIFQYTTKAKEIQANTTADLAELIKKYPEIDPAALAEVSAIDAFYDIDDKGNKKLKDLNKIDPTKRYAIDALTNHPDKVFIKGKALDDELNTFDKEKEPFGKPSVYDNQNNRTFIGFKGNYPSRLVEADLDKNENTVITTRGKLATLPDGTLLKMPVKDPATGNINYEQFKVIDEQNYSSLIKRPGVFADVNNRAKEEIDALNEINRAKGNPEVSMTGPLAETWKRKVLYDMVQEKVKDRYKLTPEDDESQKRKDAAERLNLAKEDNYLARQKLNWEKLKADKKVPTIEDITPLTVSIAKDKGVDVYFDGKDKPPTRVVYTKDIDPKDMNMVTGTNKDEKNLVKPYKITGSPLQYYKDLGNGDWEGEGGKIIKWQRVVDDQLKYLTKEDTPASSKGNRSSGLINKAKNFLNGGGNKPKAKKKLTW